MDKWNFQTLYLADMYKNAEYRDHDLRISLNKKGPDFYSKTRHPVKYGIYSEVRTSAATLQFNLNHEIVRARGNTQAWPSEREWLHRSLGNQWVYYSTGGYGGAHASMDNQGGPQPVCFRIPTPYSEVLKAFGEYYLPEPEYPTNSILGSAPFENQEVKNLVQNWYSMIKQIRRSRPDLPHEHREFLDKTLENSPAGLKEKAEKLYAVTGESFTVLPPDARHVNYQLIPLVVSRGCSLKCRFCRVKSSSRFSVLSRQDIKDQIKALRSLLGPDLINYNSVFLGDHDALSAPEESILFAAEQALKGFESEKSYMQNPAVFMFGSPEALLGADNKFLKRLNGFNCRVFINTGLESADQKTLDHIGKPLKSATVLKSFYRMLEINEEFENIQVTANFVIDRSLPGGHLDSLAALIEDQNDTGAGKGGVYLSPLCITPPSPRDMFDFSQLKAFSRLPVYLYVILRL